MQISKKRLSLPGWLLIAFTTGAFLFYALFAMRLVRLLAPHLPYVRAFYSDPGNAAIHAAALFGLLYIAPQWRTRPYARMMTIGFSLFLLGPLLNALYAAWATHDHRADLQTTIFDDPTKRAIWTWWFRLNIPAAISAIGMLLIVMAGMGATCTSCKIPAKDPANKATKNPL